MPNKDLEKFEYLHEYRMSLEVTRKDYPFYALIMAAMRQSDTDNCIRLKHVFPDVWKELKELYNTPGAMG